MSLGQSRHIFLRPLWLSEADVTGQTLISQIRGEFELTRLSGVKSSACHLVSIKRRSHSQQNIGNIHPQVVSMLLAWKERAAEKKQVFWAHPEILHRSQKQKKSQLMTIFWQVKDISVEQTVDLPHCEKRELTVHKYTLKVTFISHNNLETMSRLLSKAMSLH